jgi:aerobic carbon-monoxide dehydrogenase medium subunit
VIPAEFDYVAPETLDEALAALKDGGEDAKLLAGGHSLLPLMKLRLAAPTLLVDLRRVPGLTGIERSNGGWSIGALTTHSMMERESELGLISTVAHTIADPQVRNRGTIGGSLAHGDPASDQLAILLAYEGSVVIRGESGEREVAAADLFEDYLTTAVGEGEVLTETRWPALDGYGFGYQKFNRRKEDWAMVAVSALVKKAGDGSCEDVRIGLTHMGNVPLRATAAEAALRGGALDASSIAAAAEQAAEGTEPPGDLNASPDYKRHLARVLCRRALEEAAA